VHAAWRPHLRGGEEVRDRALAAAAFQHRAAVAARAVLLQQHGADGGVAQALGGHLQVIVLWVVRVVGEVWVVCVDRRDETSVRGVGGVGCVGLCV
jgi:hypothetical protein